MKWQTTPRFDRDWRAIPAEHRSQFEALMQSFSQACDAYARDPVAFVWPAALRVSRMTGVRGIWEMTWSFARPDGRATFEFVLIEGEMHLRWRRIGDHAIYQEP